MLVYKNLKRTLFNTIKIRTQMVREFGYRPTTLSWLIFGLQVVGLSWWPETWLRLAYLVARGLVQPRVLLGVGSTANKSRAVGSLAVNA